MAKYVLSDIHGNEYAWERMLEKIKLVKDDTLYVLGDVIDRRQYGIAILKEIIQMPNVKMLLGNHEYMMLQTVLSEPNSSEFLRAQDQWYMNGGAITYNAFQRQDEAWRDRIIGYLRNLPLEYWEITPDGVKVQMVHAAPPQFYKEYGKRYKNQTEYCVWDRRVIEAKIANNDELDYCVIFGHTPTDHFQIDTDGKMHIYQAGPAIGIDCGAAYPGGRLCCLRLDDGKVFYTDNKTKPLICYQDQS